MNNCIVIPAVGPGCTGAMADLLFIVPFSLFVPRNLEYDMMLDHIFISGYRMFSYSKMLTAFFILMPTQVYYIGFV